MSEIFKPGDRAQLTGPKGKMNTIVLEAGGKLGTHKGDIHHDQIIGLPSGSVIENRNGDKYLVLKPLLSDYVLSMPRGAQIIYPKDAAQIIVEGDIFPGATVIEAGVGSGALSAYLLRAIGDHGHLHSFEVREEFAQIAQANVANFLDGEPKNWTVRIGKLQEQLPLSIEGKSADRAILDMLAPWECVEAVHAALRPGGLLVVYVATVTQLSRTVEEIKTLGGFTDPNAFETTVRPWHLEGLAVRPEHRMIGHTGFLMTTRRLADDTTLPDFRTRRVNKAEFSDADMESWLPEAMGVRPIGEKKLRKTVRKVTSETDKRKN
jgi:tRNA (adenine57-N1/adenine58-N1)-methyltransferase